MARGRRKLVVLAAAGAAVLAGAVLVLRLAGPGRATYVVGAVLRDDPDPNKQRPIGNARIIVASGAVLGEAASDPSGFFRADLHPPVAAGRTIRLTVQHPDYRIFETTTEVTDRIYVFRLTPDSPTAGPPAAGPAITISNVRVRYALKRTNLEEVGSAVRTFAIVNKGNVPCEGRPPCSPDGKWKAAVNSLSLDAGAGKEFRNVRVSCIAGPCPFTRIEADGFSRGGRVIRVSVRNWSDSVTYLVEAEVAQSMASDMIRHSYPVIFGRSMNFTLPAGAQGPSIEAEVDRADIVFPLGPRLTLSWARCRLEVGQDGTRLYRCELKPGYQFH